MQVILLERVAKLGTIGDIVSVKNGYGRNFLIPQGKALLANESNKQVFDARKAEIEAKNEQMKGEAQKLKAKIEGLAISIIRQASPDGQLYGSVSARDIAGEVAKKFAEINYHHVNLDFAIKTTGSYTIDLVLHPDVVYSMPLTVARSDAEAAEANKAAKAEEAAPAETAVEDASEAA